MNRLLLTLALILTAISASVARTVESIPNVQLQNMKRYVSDPDGYLSPATLAEADAIIDSIKSRTTVETVVVIVSSLDNTDIDSAATELFNSWRIGMQNNNGILIIVDINNRNAVVRTGKGIEGVIPDVTAHHLIRDNITKSFKNENYDEGIINLLNNISQLVTTPEAVAELKGEKAAVDSGFEDFIVGYVLTALVSLLIMIFVAIFFYNASSVADRQVRYERLRKLALPYLMISVAFLGIPIFSYFLVKTFMKRVRQKAPSCPNCSHRMRLIDEVHDNDFLTPAQDKEEQLNSVDYDVWLCDNCNATEVYPFVNRQSNYRQCEVCGARAEILESDTVLRQPTPTREGLGRKQYYCKNCGNRRVVPYKIEKAVSAAAPIILGGMGALGSMGRGGGGGGFGGGGFGGGITGGGGASGSW